ncbi:MAG: zinc-dependent metalloprotease family protein, partial [Saprospiraceae bacterium]
VYPQNLADQYGSIAPYANNFNNALNFALRNSEVIHKTKIVGVELYPETWTNQNDDDPLVDVNQLHNSLSNPNSEISEMRDNYQADIVILLTKGHNYQDVSGGDGVGHTYSQYANSANDACSVVQMNSALSNAKTFQHEIGHIFGGGHEGVPNISCPSAKGYSFNLGINKYMTIMHTRSDQDPTRTRVHHFSNPDVLYNNMVSTGSNVNNVAECLNQSMCEIANYIPDGLCSFQTECNFLDLCLSNQLFIHVLGNENVPLGCSFLTYEYYYSIDGINYQFIACDNEMYYCDVQLPFFINRYQKLFIKTIVRNNLSIVDISFNAVTPFCDRPIETIKREEESQSLVNKFRLQPNVVESELKISFFYTELNEDVQFVIFDINSNVVYQYKFSITQEETNVTIDVSGLPSGFYSCIAKKNDQIQSDKFFKIKL